jgi:hypothetical protein
MPSIMIETSHGEQKEFHYEPLCRWFNPRTMNCNLSQASPADQKKFEYKPSNCSDTCSQFKHIDFQKAVPLENELETNLETNPKPEQVSLYCAQRDMHYQLKESNLTEEEFYQLEYRLEKFCSSCAKKDECKTTVVMQFIWKSENEINPTLKRKGFWIGNEPENELDSKKEQNRNRSEIENKIESGEFKKFDSGAIRGTDKDDRRYDLIPKHALDSLAETLAYGAKKYGALNWRKGIPDSDLINHCLQHIFDYLEGSVDDQEPHLDHAFCNLAFLIHFVRERAANLPPDNPGC